ncbi:AAA family ATPase [Leuconostoc sp. JNUCC 76]
MLKKISYTFSKKDNNKYPFTLKWLRSSAEIDFDNSLTFIVGDNGVGKSTLLQSIAIKAQIPQLTNEPYSDDLEYQAITKFAHHLKIQWDIKSQKGFFFRADDFISFVRKTKRLREDLENELDKLTELGVGELSFERLPYKNSLTALKNTYPKELESLSHGQAFLSLFKSRLSPRGLYILDEPEIPLSSQNQLALLYMINEQIKNGAQFIIASHSPIITAFPNARIYNISSERIEQIEYNEIENVQFMTSFMNDPKRFMHHILK